MKMGIWLTISAVVLFRLAGPLAGGEFAAIAANFSPLAAVVVGSALFLPQRAAWMVPFGALFISTLILSFLKGTPLNGWVLAQFLAFGLLFALGKFTRPHRHSLGSVLGATLAGSLFFYLFTNSLSFAFDSSYPHSFSGWMQCLTVGVPSYPPTWLFGLKSLLSDTLFMGLMVLCCRPQPQSRAEGLLNLKPVTLS